MLKTDQIEWFNILTLPSQQEMKTDGSADQKYSEKLDRNVGLCPYVLGLNILNSQYKKIDIIYSL